MSKEVKIDRRPNGRFRLTHGSDSGETEATYPAIECKKGAGPQLIVFKLASGPEKFAPEDPIWVSDREKPVRPTKNDEIVSPMVFDAGKTLVVLNKNSKAGTLNYNLNMVRNDETHQLDPVITNGGGGGGHGASWTSYALAGAAGGAVLSLLFVSLALGWRPVR